MDAHFVWESDKRLRGMDSLLTRPLYLGKGLWGTVERCLHEEGWEGKWAWRRKRAGKSERESKTCRKGEWAQKGVRGGEKERRICWKEAFLSDGRKTTMETPSEENQDQRQDKRGTNKRSQRASSVLFTAVFTGALTYSSLLGFTLYNSWVDSLEAGNFLMSQHPFLVFACKWLLIFQLQIVQQCVFKILICTPPVFSFLQCFECARIMI